MEAFSLVLVESLHLSNHVLTRAHMQLRRPIRFATCFWHELAGLTSPYPRDDLVASQLNHGGKARPQHLPGCAMSLSSPPMELFSRLEVILACLGRLSMGPCPAKPICESVSSLRVAQQL